MFSFWYYNSTGFEKCCTEWNKAVRRTLGLPYNSQGMALNAMQHAVKYIEFESIEGVQRRAAKIVHEKKNYHILKDLSI